MRLLEDAAAVAHALGLAPPPPRKPAPRKPADDDGQDKPRSLPDKDPRLALAAARAGRAAVLARVASLGGAVDVGACWVEAVRRGHVRVMAWLRDAFPRATRWEFLGFHNAPGGAALAGGPCALAAGPS